VTQIPNILEINSYAFFFPAIISGPLLFYQDYEYFIKNGPPANKSCSRAVARKLGNAVLAMALNVIGNKMFNPKSIADETFLNSINAPEKLLACIVCVNVTKSKFYFAWSASDAACNVAGFGCAREDEDEDKDEDFSRKVDSTQTSQKGHPKDEDKDDLSEMISVGSKRKCTQFTKGSRVKEEDDLSQANSHKTKAKGIGLSQLLTPDGLHMESGYQYDQETMASCEEDMRQVQFGGLDQEQEDKIANVDEDDEWDLSTNIKPMGIELAPNLRSVTDNWNIQTHFWVKYVCYDRTPSALSLTLSYILIAAWHGFYPGYWISFVQAAVLTQTSRLVRRTIRPMFLAPNEGYNLQNPKKTKKKLLYDFLTWLTTQLGLTYNMAPFCILEFQGSVNFYKSVHWCGHCIVGVAIVVLSVLSRLKIYPSRRQTNTNIQRDETTDEHVEGLEGTWSASPSVKTSREKMKRD